MPSNAGKIMKHDFLFFVHFSSRKEKETFFFSVKLACRYNNLILRGSVEYFTDHFTFSLMTHQNMCLKKLIFCPADD